MLIATMTDLLVAETVSLQVFRDKYKTVNIKVEVELKTETKEVVTRKTFTNSKNEYLRISSF